MIAIGQKKKAAIGKTHVLTSEGVKLVNVYAKGTVIYIHPKWRYVELLFDFSPYGKYREAFRLDELGESYG